MTNSKLRLFSSDRAETNKESLIKKKNNRLLKTRNHNSVVPVKSVNSIPFKRQNDNITGIGPGSYEPNVSAIHKKIPFTKIMKSTLLNKKATMDNVNRIIDSVRKPEKVSIHRKISTHRLNHENAVFSSRTKRAERVRPSPGPGMYEAGYEHFYVKNNPEGFGSTTERNYLINRNIIDSPFTDPTNLENPGVGSYGKKRKYTQVESKNNIK